MPYANIAPANKFHKENIGKCEKKNELLCYDILVCLSSAFGMRIFFHKNLS